MRYQYGPLQKLIKAIFTAAGCQEPEAEAVSDHLVQANLAGHDSHGVIRTHRYVRWIGEGKVIPNRQIEVIFENEVMALVDGGLGFGQSIGKQAMQMCLEKVGRFGLSVVALRNSAHLGRIGHWAEMAARAGKISLHFVNSTGLGMLVAPVGGINRRLSANPVAAAIPLGTGQSIILDISTSTVAEGKLQVARNRGTSVPDNCIIDSQGQPTNDPEDFYADPPGALLPFGGHKGYGLGIVTEILAGALTGGGCSRTGITQLEQGMVTVAIDPQTLQGEDSFYSEVRRFIDFVKSSEKASPDSQIFMPGEIEENNRATRRAEGIELDETTWGRTVSTAEELNVPRELIDAAAGD